MLKQMPKRKNTPTQTVETLAKEKCEVVCCFLKNKWIQHKIAQEYNNAQFCLISCRILFLRQFFLRNTQNPFYFAATSNAVSFEYFF